MARSIVDRLLASDEPSVRWKVRVGVAGEDPGSPSIRRLRGVIRRSPRVRALLQGHAGANAGTYSKWLGGHWVLAALADLGYPEGDRALEPLRDAVLRTWLGHRYLRSVEVVEGEPLPRSAVPVIRGRARRCGSQQGSALLSVVRLGLEDERAGQLVERLLCWQWPDGGWNCDRRPEAACSSVHETLLPMRGLAAYGRAHEDGAARGAARRAAEVLLERRLLFHRSSGEPISADWAKLHYPAYWYYDVLAGLKGLAEMGAAGDPRCAEALDLLERKRLPDGGWAADARHYRGTGERRTHFEHVDWEPVGRARTNEWVSADALTVLTAAGRSVA